MALITHLLRLVSALVTDRNRLALENVALRHQITVLKRTTTRARIMDGSLAGNSPIPRRMERGGIIISTPVLGGLHHVYRRAG